MTTLILSAAFLTGLGWLGAIVFTAALLIKHMVRIRESRRVIRKRLFQ
jgi:hypothetical protein